MNKRIPYFSAALIALVVFYIGNEYNSSNLLRILPFITLGLGYRELTLGLWQKYAQVNRDVIYPLKPIPEIQSKGGRYNYSALVEASNNFRQPVVVRGLFKDTPAVRFWGERDYLPNAFEDCLIPVVKDGSVGTLQDDREIERFPTAFHRVYDSNYSRSYLFFPAKSRYTFKGVTAEENKKLEDQGNKIARKDLGLYRIREGFSESPGSGFVTAQYVIGKSPDDLSLPAMGSDFHCAVANNFFIQVVGRKRWEFVMPEYSAFMWPLKGGLHNMWNGNPNMAEDSLYIPRSFVDLEPGDMIINPPWQWHKIINYPGLSIGVPIRDKNAYNTLVNNPYFLLITGSNAILDMLGLSLGGFPPPSASTEHDN